MMRLKEIPYLETSAGYTIALRNLEVTPVTWGFLYPDITANALNRSKRLKSTDKTKIKAITDLQDDCQLN